ncbi:hypothetical protein Q8F57_003105 [Paraburkholderia terrae]|uniref:hypothetical protein n=1 Tax=Paraburkholderia terrae TaxID=311230 RepID=UPI00296AFF5F|nr:hypothetical protein [Paraburkholderia terrae]MDW3655487.1 hypothetical protein [Paraburkholderia terrae]
MNKTSPAATGTSAAAIAFLVAVIASVNNRFGLGLTEQDQVSLAGGVVVGVHWIAQQYAARTAQKMATGRLISTQTFLASGSYTPTPATVPVKIDGANGESNSQPTQQ